VNDVVVLADDLIWASRLAAAVERAGARPVRWTTVGSNPGTGEDVPAVVDLMGRRFDGVEAVRMLVANGRRVIAVAQHEDLDLRKRAIEAGASRVFSYQKFFSDGPAIVTQWLLPAAAVETP
jgi:CheY-like chemotaxis protein